MFIGRKHEIDELERLYIQNTFQCIIIWGRRRVGKTTLINEFVKDKETIFFTGIESSYKDNLEGFSRSIASLNSNNVEHAPVYQSFQHALDAVYDLAKKRHIVLVIDEYPYLARSYRPISSLLQKAIDLQFKNSNLFVILCGSSMSFMEKQVLGYQSPLYGRRTGQFKIKPFTFYEVRDYYPDMNMYDLAVLYGITGGIPQYMACMDASFSLQKNIEASFLSTSGYMYEEPHNLMKQELREPAVYNAIIKAIATGSSKESEIASKAGLDAGKLGAYVEKLLELGIVERETPAGSKNSRKTIYNIKDGMFRFWYTFVPAAMLFIQRNRSDRAWNIVEKHLSDYMGKTFEMICMDYLWEIYDELPVAYEEFGRWWGTNPVLRREEEIDIVAFAGDQAIIGECKWRNEKVDADVLHLLMERSKLLPYKEYYYMIFSKVGFTDRCINEAEKYGHVRLVSYEDMVRIK